jgi:hypothetical protein
MKYFKLAFALILSIYFITFSNNYITQEKWNLIDSVNLVIHEAGHPIFSFFGQFISVLGGSFFQILVPAVFVIYFFFWRKEYFSTSILLFWLGQSIINVAKYMSDAINQNLPLLGGDSVIHDWNYILSSMNILKYTNVLSSITFNIGLMTIIIGAVLSLYFAWYNQDYESTT